LSDVKEIDVVIFQILLITGVKVFWFMLEFHDIWCIWREHLLWTI